MTSDHPRLTPRVIAALTTLVVVIFGAGLAIYLEPIALGTWFMRARMVTIGGMDAHEVEGPDGTLVVFEGGPADGPPIVLVHGLEDHAGTWWETAPLLVKRGWRVIAYDQPGHGESGPAQGPLTSETLLRALDFVVGSAGDPVVLVGNSLGGALALRFALDHPERVDHLVLVNAAGMAFEPDPTLFLPRNADDTERTMRAVMGPDALLPPRFVLEKMVETVREGATPRLWESISSAAPLEPELGRVSVPTDVIWGEDDGLLQLELGRRMAGAIPGARWHVIAKCGHSPQVLCPDAFNPVLVDVLEVRSK